MHEQNEFNKEIKNLKNNPSKNPRAEKYSD